MSKQLNSRPHVLRHVELLHNPELKILHCTIRPSTSKLKANLKAHYIKIQKLSPDMAEIGTIFLYWKLHKNLPILEKNKESTDSGLESQHKLFHILYRKIKQKAIFFRIS